MNMSDDMTVSLCSRLLHAYFVPDTYLGRNPFRISIQNLYCRLGKGSMAKPKPTNRPQWNNPAWLRWTRDSCDVAPPGPSFPSNLPKLQQQGSELSSARQRFWEEDTSL